MSFSPETRVYRYMSFAKFIWMLQTKQLWLTNARYFDDKWEMIMDGSQINAIINNRPPSMTTEDALTRIKDHVTFARKATFVSCWNASEDESHALWHLYCPNSEGVAIQTTFDRLKKSVEPLPVLKVRYNPNMEDDILDLYKLAAQKRPMFAYEQEARVVHIENLDDEDLERKAFGTGIAWDLEAHIENIWLHPDAQQWFAETVTQTVRRLAPRLGPRVWYSTMDTTPPV